MLRLGIEDIAKAGEIIRSGGLVAFPTETVYGLGANALDEAAVRKIYAAKGRPSDNPLIIHIADEKDLRFLTTEITKSAEMLMQAFWPGPLTLIMKKHKSLPKVVTGGRDTAAIRFPAHPAAIALIKSAGVPIAAPSANISGRVSPTKALHVLEDLDGKIDALVEGEACRFGIESAIVDVTGDKAELLRPGSITKSMLESVLKQEVLEAETTEEARAPGMKYAHYRPLAEVIIVCGGDSEVADYINARSDGNTGVLASAETFALYKSARAISAGSRKRPEEIAANMFDSLRMFDLWQVSRCYSEAFYGTEVGGAVMNRLEKAAAGNVIRL